MSNFVLKGHVSYSVKKRYKWIADFGKNTCKKCAELNGREFDEDDVPFWPYPNCRCKVEEISVVDDITAEINEYKEELQQLKLQANELLGDSRVTRAKFENLLREHPTKEVKALDIKLVKIEFDVYKLIDKIEAYTIDTISKFEISRVQKRIEELGNLLNEKRREIEDFVVKKMERNETIKLGKLYSQVFNMPESYNLLKIALNVDNFNEKCVKQNGKLYSSIKDLNNYKLQKEILARVRSEMDLKDCKVLMLNTASSLAKKIEQSVALSNFLKEYSNLLERNQVLDRLDFEFTNADKDLYSTFHGVKARNIYVDEQGYLNMRIEDFYNFNPDRPSVKGQIGYKLQKQGDLEPYFVIVVLRIDKNIWGKYLNRAD